jgi:hypothetical protein
MSGVTATAVLICSNAWLPLFKGFHSCFLFPLREPFWLPLFILNRFLNYDQIYR